MIQIYAIPGQYVLYANEGKNSPVESGIDISGILHYFYTEKSL